MTVTLETSVPLFSRCNPKVTLNGLTEAVELEAAVFNTSNPTQKTRREVNVTNFANHWVGVSQNVSMPFMLDSFDREAGKMVLRVENNTMAGITYKITFKLRHRAQQSGGVSVSLSVAKVLTTTYQSQESRVSSKEAYGYDFKGAFELTPGPQEAKPMKVKELRYRSYAGQTSFNPCDNNVIWVKMEAVDLKILHSCSPTVTISGLTNAQTPSGSISVTNKDQNDATVNGVWTKETGTFTLDLKSLFSLEAAAKANNKTEDSFKTSFHFTFTLINPTSPQKDQSPQIVSKILLGSHHQTTTAAAISRFTHSSNTTSALTWETSTVYSLPLHVKELDFDVRKIRQATPYPCDDNKITVDLRSNIDLVVSCQWKITISGLTNSFTPDNSALSVSTENSTSTIATSGDWTRSSGQLVLSLTTLVSKAKIYSLGFVLVNPQSHFTNPQIVIKAQNKGYSAGSGQDMAESEENAPSDIHKFSTDYAGQKEAWPLNVRNLAF
jgi:hypothetical protein